MIYRKANIGNILFGRNERDYSIETDSYSLTIFHFLSFSSCTSLIFIFMGIFSSSSCPTYEYLRGSFLSLHFCFFSFSALFGHVFLFFGLNFFFYLSLISLGFVIGRGGEESALCGPTGTQIRG